MNRTLRFGVFLALSTISVASLPGQAHKDASMDKDYAELEHYTLTLDKVTRLAQIVGELNKISETNPDVKTALSGNARPNETMADSEHDISAFPQVIAVISSHGMTAHEFIVTQISLVQTIFAETVKKSGADPAKLAAEAHVNLTNLAFIEQHQADIDKLDEQYGLFPKKKKKPVDESVE
jgi:hypothetical protein